MIRKAFATAVIFGVVALLAWQAFSGGEERGVLVLLGLVVAGSLLAALAVVVRDGDVAQTPGPGAEPAESSGPLPAPWPATAALGVAGAAAADPALRLGLSTLGGALVNQAVGDAHGLPVTDAADLLPS